VFRPDPECREMTVTCIHPGITREHIRKKTGWPVRFSDNCEETSAPGEHELAVLRDLHKRTAFAHQAQ